MHVVNRHTTIALRGTIIRPMYATTVMTIINLHLLSNVNSTCVTTVHVTNNPFIGVICYIEVTRLKSVAYVAIGGSAGSRNRGPRLLGAPTVVIIYFICKTQNNQDSEETEIRSLAFSKTLGLLTAFIFFASWPSTNDVTLFWPIFDPLPLVT